MCSPRRTGSSPQVTMTERSMNGGVVGLEQCTEIGCSVSDPLPGQVLAFLSDGASAALASVKDIKEKGVPHDQWLFERIAEAAVAAAADGGVWKSGGKYILSALSRNQSPTALKNYLTTMGQGKCAEGIDALVKWTEKQYKHSVSAIQINVHFDSTSFHAQHRDIYGLEQRDMAGRDCTCSFKPNIATACLSLGSTRRCLVEAETDDYSEKKLCGPACKGYHCSHWLRSGNLMYFNDVWNRSHNHGIPKDGGDASEDGKGGPRISIAMLCAAADDASCSFDLRSKPKNIYATLVDGGRTSSKPPAVAPSGPPITLEKSRFVTLTLESKKMISQDTRLFRFKLPSKEHELGLPVGQHLLLRAKGPDGEYVTRAYTPVRTGAGFVDFVIKVYLANVHPRFPEGGQLTPILDALKEGDTVDVKGPFGQYIFNTDILQPKSTVNGSVNADSLTTFTHTPSGEKKLFDTIGFIAGGSGITPVLQVCHALVANAARKLKISILFANRTVEDILCKDLLDELAKDPRVTVWYTVDVQPEHQPWKYSVGFVNREMIEAHLPKPAEKTVIFMCGPPPMLNFACKPNLEKAGHIAANVLYF
jgi:NAD(P)H-flavin reductase